MSPPERYPRSWLPRFARLQQLEISSWDITHSLEIIQGVSSTLVSLVLHVHDSNHVQLSFLPQLRHLRVIKYTVSLTRTTLDLDAPHLESIHHVFYGPSWGNWTYWDTLQIRPRNPGTVKHLRVMAEKFDASPYPALRTLWIDSHRSPNYGMLEPIGCGIASCPELETILYSHPSGEANRIFPAILDVVRKTGRHIDVRGILPNQWDLPGDMRRSVSIAGVIPLSS
jgi:hypothetical protein